MACLDDTAIGTCAKDLGYVNPHALVAELAIMLDNDV